MKDFEENDGDLYDKVIDFSKLIENKDRISIIAETRSKFSTWAEPFWQQVFPIKDIINDKLTCEFNINLRL